MGIIDYLVWDRQSPGRKIFMYAPDHINGNDLLDPYLVKCPDIFPVVDLMRWDEMILAMPGQESQSAIAMLKKFDLYTLVAVGRGNPFQTSRLETFNLR